MSPSLALPADLSADERALVEAMRAAAEERAALAISVRREMRRLVGQGLGVKAAFTAVADDPRFSVSAGTAEDIWRRRGAWAA